MKIVMLPAMHIITPGGREYWANINPALGDDVVAPIDKELHENVSAAEILYQIFPYFRIDAAKVVESRL